MGTKTPLVPSSDSPSLSLMVVEIIVTCAAAFTKGAYTDMTVRVLFVPLSFIVPLQMGSHSPAMLSLPQLLGIWTAASHCLGGMEHNRSTVRRVVDAALNGTGLLFEPS